MNYKIVPAKNYEEAIEKSGLRVGQLARITEIRAHGTIGGKWTVHPTFEPLSPEEENNLRGSK